MKTESVKINSLKLNPENPRTFTDYNLKDIVKSLLVFPEMNKIRPMAITENYPIGGNLRLKGFQYILKMKLDEIAEIIGLHSKDKSKERIEFLIDYWQKFQEKKVVEIVDANNLSEQQRKEFTIRDNISLGSWNFDELANSWEVSDLKEWGVEIPLWGENETEQNDETVQNEKFQFILTYPQNEYEILKGVIDEFDLNPEMIFQKAITQT